MLRAQARKTSHPFIAPGLLARRLAASGRIETLNDRLWRGFAESISEPREHRRPQRVIAGSVSTRRPQQRQQHLPMNLAMLRQVLVGENVALRMRAIGQHPVQHR